MPVFLDQEYIGTALLNKQPLHLCYPRVHNNQCYHDQTSVNSLHAWFYYDQRIEPLLLP